MLTYKQYFTDDIQLHLYLHAQCHMHTKGSVVISIKPNAKEGFCMAIMLLFYIIQKYYEKVPHFSQSVATYHFSTKTWFFHLTDYRKLKSMVPCPKWHNICHIKPKANDIFCMATIMLFYITQMLYQKLHIFSRSMATHHFRTTTWWSYHRSSHQYWQYTVKMSMVLYPE
jgi:hypothetical protein